MSLAEEACERHILDPLQWPRPGSLLTLGHIHWPAGCSGLFVQNMQFPCPWFLYPVTESSVLEVVIKVLTLQLLKYLGVFSPLA